MAKNEFKPEVSGYVITAGSWFVRDVKNEAPLLGSLSLATIYPSKEMAQDMVSRFIQRQNLLSDTSIKRTFKVVSLNELNTNL